MADEEINKTVNIDVKAGTGLQKFIDDSKLANDELASLGLAAATSQNKLAGVASALKEIVAQRIMGQLGAMAGLFMGIVTAMYALARSSDAARKAMAAVAELEFAETQFAPLLKGIQNAKDRIQELFLFAQKTPFEFGEVTAASRVLQVLTRGALTTEKAMRQIGDAAATSGAGFQEVAQWVGRLYDGLQSGRPVGEALARLQELGIVSGEARNKIESLSEAGASYTTTWQEVEKELKRSEGGMEALSNTLTGLQSNLEDTRKSMSAKFGKPFLEAEKAGVQATIKAFENLTPVVEAFAKGVAQITNPVEKFIYSLADMSTGLTKIVPLIQAAFPAALGATLAALTYGIFSTVQSILMLNGVITATAAVTATSTAATTVMNGVQAANGVIAKASALAQGLYNIAVGEGTIASKAGTAALVLYRTAMLGIRAAAAMAASSLYALAINPWTYIVAGTMAAVAAIAAVTSALNDASESMEALNNAANDMNASFAEQAKAVQTVDDKMKLIQKSYVDLAKAEKAYQAEVEKAPTLMESWFTSMRDSRIKAAALTVEQARRNTNKAKAIPEAPLGMGEKDLARERARRATLDQGDEIDWSARYDQGNIDAKMRVTAERRARLQERINMASNESNAQRNTANQQRDIDFEINKRSARIDTIGEKIVADGISPADAAKLQQEREALQAEINNLNEQKAQVARDSASEIVRLTQAAADARKSGDFIRAQQLQLKAEDKQKYVDQQFENQNKDKELGVQQQNERQQKAELALSMDVLAIEKKIAQLKKETKEDQDKADALEIEALNKQLLFEQMKTDEKRDQAKIAQLENSIVAQRTAMEKRAIEEKRTNQNIKDEIRLTELQIQQSRAARAGNFRGAANARNQQQQVSDEQFQRNRMVELRKTMTAPDAQAQLDREMAQRKAERKESAQEYRANLAAETKIMALRNQGRGQEARAIEDAQPYRDKVNEGINAGLGAEEAQKGAMDFMRQKMMAEQPQITADSMRAIGFGGNAAGGDDRGIAVQERIEKLQTEGLTYLKSIAEDVKKTSTNGAPSGFE